jgi:acetamidase/formamidase
VEGAEPGDVLEVKVLSIDLPIDYGYNGCSGFSARTATERRHDDHRARSQTMTATFRPAS